MSSIIWILVILGVLAALLGGGKKKPASGEGPVRIDHPHYMDEDDHECSVCGARFTGKGIMACPRCGAKFAATREDDGEFMEEMELWDGDED